MRAAAHVLLVEDDDRLAASLRRTLEYAGFVVGHAADGPAALLCAARDKPDVMILDVLLPGLDGLGVCRALREGGDDCLVLMLTARDATADRVAGLDSGADDYLVKPFAPEELLARIRALLRRRPSGPDGRPLTLGDLTLDPTTHEVWRGSRSVSLTAQEFALLRHFLRHPRQVRSRGQLLDAVWGGGDPSTTNVVDVYVGYLRTKLEAEGEPRLLHTVRGVGYVLRADVP